MEEAHSRGGPGWSRTGLVLKAGMPVLFLAMAVVGAMLLSSNDRAQAAGEPCADGVGASIQNVPKVAGQVTVGDTINYTVTFNNALGNCDITSFTASLTLPNGTVVPLLSNLAFPANSTVACPGNAACQTAGPYSYTILAADLRGPNPSGSCPPTPVAGDGFVHAYAQGGGPTKSGGAANVCQTGPRAVFAPDVGVTKVAKAPKINAGQVAQYNIEVTALGTGIHPGVTLTDVLPGGGAKGWTVTGTDAAACDEDPNTAGIQIVGNDLNCDFGDINPAVDATRNVSVSVTTTAAQCGTKSNTATVAMTGETDVVPGNNTVGPVIITVNCPAGGEGCTPGYWKQPHHFGNWTDPYDPGDLFDDHFENAFPGMTLLQVLSQGGGGLKALGRHTVAALLNGASDDVDYLFDDQAVINMFNGVFPGTNAQYQVLHNTFAQENERGCPLARAVLNGK